MVQEIETKNILVCHVAAQWFLHSVPCNGGDDDDDDDGPA
jgi:hypothetical protein